MNKEALAILRDLRMKLGTESMIQHRVNDYILEHLDRLEAALKPSSLGRCVYRRSPHTKIESCLDWKPL